MKSKTRFPVPMMVAAALLWLVLISIHLTSGMFARYTVNARDEGSARAAAFNVSAEADASSPVSIIADGTDNNGKAVYTVRVKNDGETAVRYEAVVSFTGEQAEENKERFDGGDDQLTFSGYLNTNDVAEKQITFDMSAYFETSENDKWNTFSNDDISGNQGKCPFEVSVKFTQVD